MAITRPWSITTMLSARRSASSRYCVVSSTVVPASTRASIVSHMPSRPRGSRPVVGSSRNSTGGRATSAAAEVEPPAHAAGVGLRRALGGLRELEALEQLVGALARLGLAEVVQPPDHLEVLEAGQVLVHGRILAREADRARSAAASRRRRGRRRGRCRRRARAASPGCAPRWSCRHRWGPAGRGCSRSWRRSPRHTGRGPSRRTSRDPRRRSHDRSCIPKLAEARRRDRYGLAHSLAMDERRPRPKLVERLEARRETHLQRSRVYRIGFAVLGGLILAGRRGDAGHARPGVRADPDRPGDAGARVHLGRAAAREVARAGADRAGEGRADDALQRVLGALAGLLGARRCIVAVLLWDIPLLPDGARGARQRRASVRWWCRRSRAGRGGAWSSRCTRTPPPCRTARRGPSCAAAR